MTNFTNIKKGAARYVSAFFVSPILLISFISLSWVACSQPPSKVSVVLENETTLTEKEEPSSMFDYSKEELLGKFEPQKHPGFVLIEKQYTDKTNIYMRKEVYDAWKKMQSAAQKEGIHLHIISATRNFNYQKGIWERKWNDAKYKGKDAISTALNILKYSAMPGASRHHWGTDLDFNSVSPSYFTTITGKKIYEWLTKHAPDFGFVQVYTSKKEGRTGYEEEHWHWSYIPISKEMLRQYNQKITYEDFVNFSGSNTAEGLKVIELFVNGIPDELK